MKLAIWSVALVVAGAACGTPETAEQSEPVTVALTQVAPIGYGNALTLPAQRHLVRIGDSYLAAVQQDGAGGRGLGFYRSDDDGNTWSYLAAIQNDWTHRDTADLLVVGNDIALVHSWEGPTLTGSTRHDVVFQWWRARGGTWTPDPKLVLFDSVSSTTGYYRAELARDSHGRIWVQAFKLEPAGGATARIAVSSDGGAHFVIEPHLGSLAYRGGGRLISLGTRLLFVFDGHEAGLQPARFRVRDDGDALDHWSPIEHAFSEGIYHGAALSAVADGDGGLHLVYKDKTERLWYRHFDGDAFGPRTLLDDSEAWEVQPAITRLGDDLAIFYNRAVVSGSDDEVRYRLLQDGTVGPAQVLDATISFKGYPAAVDVLPGPEVPCLFGVIPNGGSSGNLLLYTVGASAATARPRRRRAAPTAASRRRSGPIGSRKPGRSCG